MEKYELCTSTVDVDIWNMLTSTVVDVDIVDNFTFIS